MICRKCKEEMTVKIMTSLPEPQEREWSCKCGEVAWDGELYPLTWIDRQEED